MVKDQINRRNFIKGIAGAAATALAGPVLPKVSEASAMAFDLALSADKGATWVLIKNITAPNTGLSLVPSDSLKPGDELAIPTFLSPSYEYKEITLQFVEEKNEWLMIDAQPIDEYIQEMQASYED